MTTLTITIGDDGKVQVSGPINNKLLCYGILEAGRDAIRDYQPPKSSIVPIRGPLLVPREHQ